MPNAPEYPRVQCADHPNVNAPGYGVCSHVLAGALPFYVERATTTELGLILCREDCDDDDPTLTCAVCAAPFLRVSAS